ncbi:MAG: spermidine/putrescine transport system permease protein, partial [Actinomycetota bacterium]|nr:spermidine/putrescine transport system permease protein [Actinomycetota bacterium]
MAVAVVETQAGARRRRRFSHWQYLFIPTIVLLFFFVAPMLLMVRMSVLRYPPSSSGGYTFSHYVNVLGDPIYRRIAVTTFVIATSAQLVMLAVGIPLAYIMAFKAGRWELILLLLLVLADELNPIVKIYAWRMLLGREGLINGFLMRTHLVGQPVTWMLFGRFSVIVTLATSWITYTTIPIYAAMKAIDPALFHAAEDLGAGWWTKARKILLPLAAPGIFIAM